MDADYSFDVKNIDIWTPPFFKHNNSFIATVCHAVLFQLKGIQTDTIFTVLLCNSAPEHQKETKWSQLKIDEDVLNKKNLSNQENATETVLSKVEKGDLVKKKLIKGGRTTGIKI